MRHSIHTRRRRRGARGYLLKGADRAEIARATKAISNGEAIARARAAGVS
jgi:DNA-binding NarL/FixJ family response regulator